MRIIILVVSVTIRLLKKNEIGEVAKLLVDAYKKEEKAKRWQLTCAETYVLMLYRMCKELCFVAIEGGKIVGTSLNIIMPEYTKEIVESKILLVHPDFRKREFGSKLLRRVCIKAENKYNIKDIECNIDTLTNFPITWYERIGFRTRKNYEVTRADIAKVLRSI